MSMTAALRDRLKAAPSISALVEDRVFRIVRTQGSDLPAITLQTISAPVEYFYQGRQRLQWARVQTDCWGESQGVVEALSGAVAAVMEPSAIVGQCHFARAFVDGSRDLGEQDVGRFIYRISTDFIVWWTELGALQLMGGGNLLLMGGGNILEIA